MNDFISIGKKMKQLLEQGRLEERNALVPTWCQAYYSYDFGFKVGEEVEFFDGNRYRIGKILKRKENNQFVFPGDIEVCATLIRQKREHYEQIELL